jgi:thioredoxin-dependent peroxiredoxin
VKLQPGMPAPDFELPDAAGKIWRLADLSGKRVILYFYPIDDTPGCTAEACDFRDARDDFATAGYEVLGVSPQDADSHKEFSAKYGLNFPLLVDTDMRVADAYGAMSDEGRDFEGIPIEITRSTFVIDEDGRIESAEYGVKARGHVSRLQDRLQI